MPKPDALSLPDSSPSPASSGEGFFHGLSRTKNGGLVLAAGAGIFFGAPNPIVHLPHLALLTPFALFLLAWFSRSKREAFTQGWLAGLLGQASSLYWLTLPITEVGGLPLAPAAACVVLLSAYLSLFTGLTCLAGRAALHIYGQTPAPSEKGSSLTAARLAAVAAPLITGLAWGGFEVINGRLFTGFPWLSLSTAFAPFPEWIQAASVIGAYGLSGLYAAAGCFLAAGLLFQRAARATCLGAGVLLLVALPLFGKLRLDNFPASSLPGNGFAPFTALLIQGNVDQNEKWTPPFQKAAVDIHLRLSEDGLKAAEEAGRSVDLILWSETCMPFYFRVGDELSETLRFFARNCRIPLAFGTIGSRRIGANAFAIFNRVQVLDATGRLAGHYDKEHLVPFGEYIPFAADIPFLHNILQGVDFSSGSNAPRLSLASTEPPWPQNYRIPPGNSPAIRKAPERPNEHLALGVLICYEAIFPELAQARLTADPAVLLTVSNDAWFGKTSAPRRHLQLTAMRAVEQMRPIVRGTNTGYSAAVDAAGRVTAESELFTEGFLLVTVQPATGLTLYHHLYPLPEIILVAVALVLTAHSTVRALKGRRARKLNAATNHRRK